MEIFISCRPRKCANRTKVMLINDNCCTYQLIQKELNIRSAATYKIIHEKISMFLPPPPPPYNLTEYQKTDHVRISKEILKLLNDEKQYIYIYI